MQPKKEPIVPNDNHKDIPGNPSTATSSRIRLSQRSEGQPLRAMTEAQWEFWMENGYVVIKNAVSRAQAEATAAFLWEFEEKDPQDTSSWYTAPRAEMKMQELAGTGMVEVYNHQRLWDNRQSSKIHQVFADIWDTEKLWVSIDRANLNFPIRPGYRYNAFIHWDYDPETKPQQVQGVLALNDQTAENMGGFQCIPWLFRNYDEWKLSQPADRNRFMPDITGLEDKIVKVPLEAGDLVIWNSSQPHGIRANHSDKPRIAQYISMMPAQEEDQAMREWRISSWQDRIAPQGYAFPGDPRNWEQERYEKAELTELGEKLLGLKSWE